MFDHLDAMDDHGASSHSSHRHIVHRPKLGHDVLAAPAPEVKPGPKLRSCTNCANSHVACDRGSPCGRCLRSNKAHLCFRTDERRKPHATAATHIGYGREIGHHVVTHAHQHAHEDELFGDEHVPSNSFASATNINSDDFVVPSAETVHAGQHVLASDTALSLNEFGTITQSSKMLETRINSADLHGTHISTVLLSNLDFALLLRAMEESRRIGRSNPFDLRMRHFAGGFIAVKAELVRNSSAGFHCNIQLSHPSRHVDRTIPGQLNVEMSANLVQQPLSNNTVILYAAANALIVWATQNLYSQMGIADHELNSTKLFELVHPDDLGLLVMQYAELVTHSNELPSIKGTFRLNNGSRQAHLMYDTEMRPVVGLDGSLMGILMFAEPQVAEPAELMFPNFQEPVQ